MNMIEKNEIKEIIFKGIDEENLICDFELEEAQMVKRLVEEKGQTKIKKKKRHPVAENARIKLDTTNKELLEKTKLLVNGDVVYIKVIMPKGTDFYNTDDCLIMDILDDIDLLEIRNQNCLITRNVPKKEDKIQPRRSTTKKVSKKDKRIAELEEENSELRSQIQILQKQLQNI